MKKTNTKALAINALFVAIVLLLGLTPLGLIPLGFINLTILHIPVIIGTILLGLKSGLILGAMFGLVSMLSMMGMSGASQSLLAYTLLERNAFFAILMCFVPRMLVPVITHGVYRLIQRTRKIRAASVPLAAVCGSLTNTVFYLGLMYLFYHLTGDTSFMMEKLGYLNMSFFEILSAIALGGGGMEALAAALISSPVVMAVNKYRRKI